MQSLRPDQVNKAVVPIQTAKQIQLTLARQEKAHTSGSVRLRAIAIIPDASTPSVKIGLMKVCIFGVKRNGTTSLVAKTGA